MSAFTLQEIFPIKTYDDWLKKIEPLLKGQSFEAALVSRTDDDIDIAPLYTASTTSNSPVFIKKKPRMGWTIGLPHCLNDPLSTLAHQGFLTIPPEAMLKSLAQVLSEPQKTAPDVKTLCADGRVYHNAGATEAQEIACIATTTVFYLKSVPDYKPKQILSLLAFALCADQDFFLTIAKYRALRLVLQTIADAFEIAEQDQDFVVLSETSTRMMTLADAENNLIRISLAAAGAALGGADIIITAPFHLEESERNAFTHRLSRNTQLILQEEASLGAVHDPAAGSWYIETLTEELAQKSWELFQKIEAQGGMLEALKSGFVQAMIRASVEKRAENYRDKKKHIVGVTAFQKANEIFKTADLKQSHPIPDGAVIKIEPLRAIRLAEEFERGQL